MIPDFPHYINYKIGPVNFFLFRPDVATGQRLRNIRVQQLKISIGPILFLYYEESMVSSNLNSKQLRFHGVRPNVDMNFEKISWLSKKKKLVTILKQESNI